MADSVDHDQTAPKSNLISVNTVYNNCPTMCNICRNAEDSNGNK